MNAFISDFILLAPPLLLALTCHEFAHGLVAYNLGDPTAQRAGRLTLNPLKHLDPIGTIAFFLIKIGWAKPVPVNPLYFRNPKKDMLLVALAGPLANFVLAVISALLLKFSLLLVSLFQYTAAAQMLLLPLSAMLLASVWINLVLCFFNFLPIPPLDGSRILVGLLPDRLAASYQKLEKYGFILILLLAYSGILSKIILPLIDLVQKLLVG